MKPTIKTAILAMLLLVAACGPNQGSRNVDRQIPAPRQAPTVPPVRAEKPDPALQAQAKAILAESLASNHPFLRANAIEATEATLATQDPSIYLKALKDTSAPVRFAAAVAIGRLQIKSAKDELVQMVNDASPQVGIGVRFALHRMGDTRFTKDLENTARDPDPKIRGTTAQILGLLKEPTATRILKPMRKDPEPGVRIQVAEALWRLGSEDGLRSLVSMTQSGYPDDQMVALIALAAPNDRLVTGHVRAALTADYPEVCLVAARAMGMLSSDAGYTIAIEGAKAPDARRRWLAALALGDIRRTDAQSALAPLLKDSDPTVKLCAAKAILQLP